jgi:hypothetical protein
MTAEVIKALEDAAKKTNVPFQALKTMALIESGGNGNVGKNKYGYTGLMQMGSLAVKDVLQNYPEAKTVGVSWSSVQTDVNMNALAGAYYYKLNSRRLSNKKVEVSPLHQYLAHQQGVGGLNKLLTTIKLDPKTKATKAQLLNLTPASIKQLGGADKVTQKDFYEHWVQVYDRKEKAAYEKDSQASSNERIAESSIRRDLSNRRSTVLLFPTCIPQ